MPLVYKLMNLTFFSSDLGGGQGWRWNAGGAGPQGDIATDFCEWVREFDINMVMS